MRRRGLIYLRLVPVAIGMFCAGPVVAPVHAQDLLHDQLDKNKDRQAVIDKELNRLDGREDAALRGVEAVNTKINAIEVPIQRLDERISLLQLQISNRRSRIVELKRQFQEQATVIVRLGKEVDIARDRLTDRAVEVYKSGEPNVDAWIVGATSIADAFERRDAVNQIVANDREVLAKIEELERKIRVKRARNHAMRARISADVKNLKSDEVELASKRAELARKKAELERAKAQRASYLRKVRGKQAELNDEFDDLQENNAQVVKAIKSGATSFGNGVLPPGMTSSGGLSWPVSGPVVSPFGPRWGRLHAGIDIAVPAGVPIHAAASGIVTYSGWMSGYGNMVIVQHAGALSTGYAHQSRIGVSKGQFVSQGMVLGYVGCTGHCFGDHLHFETRLNGVPNNPMNFL